jgi:hypothetical protein
MKADPKLKSDSRSHREETLDACLDEPRPGLVREFGDFLRHNKKWWLIPILLLVSLLGLLIVLAGTGAAPFIYTLF